MSQDSGQSFRARHVKARPFVLANAWDAGSAKMLAALGAQAMATSSAAHAFTDAPLNGSMADIARVCAATNAPVNVRIAGPAKQHGIADFAAVGAARLSLRSSLARITHCAIHDATTEMFGPGRFDRLGGGISGQQVDALLAKG